MHKFLFPFAFVFLFIYHLLISLWMILVPSRLRIQKEIKGQRILITGAGSGVGRQLAIQFSKYSTCLILLDIDKTSLQETENLLERQSTVFTYQCDVSKPEMVYKVSEIIKKEAGDIDILVNNAGIVSGKRFLDLPDEKIVKTMEVNVLAHFWICKSFLPTMITKNSGHIVSVTSMVGKLGLPLMTDYCASKYAAVGFAESLEMELRDQKIDGIKVTIVFLSHVDTGLFQGVKIPILPALTPQYVAEEIVKGVLEEQEDIYIPRWCKLPLILRGILPRWLQFWVHEKTGTIRLMENFTGRSRKPDAGKEEPEKTPVIKENLGNC